MFSSNSWGPRRSGWRTPAALAVLATAFVCLVWLGAAPAGAAGSFCRTGGVNVAVDFDGLGGGVQQACVKDGAGKVASDVFKEAGFALTPVGAFPGAACQVDGKPAGVACAKMPPANAYWGLYVGTKGTWGYASKGANELKMADGDYVAFAWQSTKKSVPPTVAPTPSPVVRASTSADQPKPTSTDDSGGIPWWIPVGVVAVLAAVGGWVAVRRRSS